MIEKKLLGFYFLSLIFVILSSIRFPYLPEIQVLLVLLLLVFSKPKVTSFVLIPILCSHFFVIPDVVYTVASETYPSIYTKVILVLKGIDYITLFLLFFGGRQINELSKLVKTPFPWILLIPTLGGACLEFIQDSNVLNFRNYAYLGRSFLLLIGVYLLTSKLTLKDLQQLSILASFTWIIKMIFSILIPAENPWIRTSEYNVICTGQATSTLYFTGMEYIILSLYLAIILTASGNELKNKKSFVTLLLTIFLVFILGTLADRRGVIVETIIMIAMVVLYNLSWIPFNRLFASIWLFFTQFLTFYILLFLLDFLPEVAQISLSKNQELVEAAFNSISAHFIEFPLSFLFGLGIGVPYEIFGLPDYLNGPDAWGAGEAYTNYKTTAPYFPFGRLILHVGVVGSIFYLYNVIKYLFKVRSFSDFYLLLAISSLTYLDEKNPIQSVALGIALSVAVQKFSNNSSLYNKSSTINALTASRGSL